MADPSVSLPAQDQTPASASASASDSAAPSPAPGSPEADDAASAPQFLSAAPHEPRGVLLVHGFSGSPYELHLLARALHQRGYHVSLPRLAGHHQSLRVLADSRYEQWLATADEALHGLHRHVAATAPTPPRLAVIGLSMGGLLTVELARRYPAPADPPALAVEAIGMLASPLWLSPFAERTIRFCADRPVLRQLFIPKVTGSDIRTRDLPPHRLRPRGMPVRALRSLLDLMAEARRHLPDVRQPALLAHAVQDHTAPYACMAAFATELGTPRDQLTCLSLPQSYHLLPLDVEREVVFAAVAEHLARHLGGPPSARS
jgi:carboxylesterase